MKVGRIADALKISPSKVSTVLSYFKDVGDIPATRKLKPAKEMSTSLQVSSFLEELYGEEGYVAGSYKELLRELTTRFPELKLVSPQNL